MKQFGIKSVCIQVRFLISAANFILDGATFSWEQSHESSNDQYF